MTTLLEVIKSYLSEAELSDAQLMRFLEIGQRGIMDLHFNVSGLPITIKLGDFNSDLLTSPLPVDYLSLVSLGYLASGVIVPFFQNPRIKLYDPSGACHPNNQNAGTPPENALNLFNVNRYPYYWAPFSRDTPNGITGGFSNMGGSAAYAVDFDIDELNGYIQYGAAPTVDVYMKYLANPRKVNKSYVVHPFDVQALIAWLAWRDIASKRKQDKTEVALKRKEYYRERGQCRKMHYGYSMDFVIQMVRQSNKATVQF